MVASAAAETVATKSAQSGADGRLGQHSAFHAHGIHGSAALGWNTALPHRVHGHYVSRSGSLSLGGADSQLVIINFEAADRLPRCLRQGLAGFSAASPVSERMPETLAGA